MPGPLDFLKSITPAMPQRQPNQGRLMTDAEVEAQQANDPGWKQLLRQGLMGGVDFAKGLTGLGDQGPAGATATNAGQVLGAALPFAGAMRAITPAEEAVTGLKGFYSRLNRATEMLPEGRSINSQSAMNLMKKAPEGISPEEVTFRKLDEFLKGKPQVSRDEVLAHLEGNPPPQVRESLKGDYQPTSEGSLPAKQPTKYAQYQVPGGSDYRESLLKLPPVTKNDPWLESNRDVYRSPHWDDPNVLVHSRYNERSLPFQADPAETARLQSNINTTKAAATEDFNPDSYEASLNAGRAYNQYHTQPGSKGRFLEEVQSDWHQQGKEKGYFNPQPSQDAQAQLDAISAEYSHKLGTLAEDLGLPRESSHGDVKTLVAMYTPEDNWPQQQARIDEIDRLREQQQILRVQLGQDITGGAVPHHAAMVPDAPFKTTWPDLALKKHVMDVASSPDLNWLGSSTGDTQAARYNLANHIDAIQYDWHPQQQKWDIVGLKNGEHATAAPGFLDDSQLEAYIGADATQALKAHRDATAFHLDDPNTMVSGEVPTNTIMQTQGAHGMHQFYDKTIPSRLEKILGPFGGKVEQGSIPSVPAPRASTPQVPAFLAHFTPEMKAAILKKGLPLLSLLGLSQLNDPQADPETPLNGLKQLSK